MSTDEIRPTATILQFPGVRRLKQAAMLGGANVPSRPNDSWPVVDCASGWYHEAAVREAERGRK